MKGSIYFKIWNKRVTYEFTINRGISVILGNSATGKTTLIRGIESYIKRGRDAGWHITTTAKNFAILSHNNWEKELEENDETVFFIDEGFKDLSNSKFATALNGCNNYLVAVSRDNRLGCLTYAISSIYSFTGNSYNELLPKHNNVLTSVKPDIIITEDENSGHDITRKLFDCKVITSHGKDNMCNVVKEQKGVCYVVVDGAAFGNAITELMHLDIPGLDIYIFAPESFEFLMLCCSKFRRLCEDELSNTENYADTREYYTWEDYYNKLLRQLVKIWGASYNKEKWKHLHPIFKDTLFLQELGSQFEDLQGILRDEYRV